MILAASVKRPGRTASLDWPERRAHRPEVPAGQDLGSYYIRWGGCGNASGDEWDNGPRDESGVLLSSAERFHQPTRIAQFALEQHARWRERGGGSRLQAFTAQARWLRDNQAERNGIAGCYPIPLAWPAYGANAGFLSAATQGQAISALLRAFETLEDRSYLEAAVTAATAFAHDVDRGGVVWRRDEDVHLEEAACVPASHILNGWICALWGLFDLRRYGGDAWVKTLYEQSLATLRRKLPLYDSGRWSYYSLLVTAGGLRRLATPKYHARHIAQLYALASMTGDTAFGTVARRWEAGAKSLPNQARVWVNAMANLPRRFSARATIPDGTWSIA